MSLVGWSAVLVAAVLEAAVGEPPTRLHPVAWFGRAVGRVENAVDRRVGDGRRVAVGPFSVGLVGVGTVAVLLLPLLAAGVVASVVLAAGAVTPIAGGVVAGLAVFLTTSLRRLLTAAREVVAASEADAATARDRLPALVGRDPSSLSPDEIRSAAVESAAENLADGLLAPLGAFVVGVVGVASGGVSGGASGGFLGVGPSVGAAVATGVTAVAAGAGLAAWVKAVNTMDSMWGYPSKPLGTASARLDDAVMYLPARVTAFLLALVAGRPWRLVAAREDAREPDSPNAGWPMATLAVLGGVRLRKPGAYDLVSRAAFPSVADGRRCLHLVRRAGIGAYAASALCVGVVA